MTRGPGSRPQNHAELFDRAVEMTRLGYSAAQISDEIDVTKRTVVRWRRTAGVSQDSAGSPFPLETWAEAEKLLDEGAPFAEVGRTLGMAAETVRNHFPGRGWTQEQTIQFMVETRGLNRALKKIA